MEDAKSINTPVPTNGNLEKHETGKDVDVKKYRGMIESLIYLTSPRLGIMFSVCMCLIINRLLRNRIKSRKAYS